MPPSGHPLSFAQQRLWFVDQLTPGLPVYNVPIVLDLEGPLDTIALVRALEEIVRRHEPLRTRFPSDAGIPRQEVLPPTHFNLGFEAVPTLSSEEREAWLEARILAGIREPFNLQTGPVIRGTLVGVDSSRHVLILVVHHIAFDGWSAGIFFRELTALYAAFSSRVSSSLPDVPLRYVDFAAQQRAAMSGDTLVRQMDFWREQLKPPRPELSWLVDRPRPSTPSFTGHRHYAIVDQALLDRVQAFCRAENVTLFMALLAVQGALIRRLTSQDEFIIGTPIANRTVRHTESLIGFFANSLALRLRVEGRATFRSLLREARRTAIGAYANQDLPFERIVEELNPERRPSHTPIIQTVLVLDNTPHGVGDVLPAGPITLGRRVVATGTAKFDLTLSLRHASTGRRAALETNADLFDRDAGARILGEFCELLRTSIDRPDLAVDDLAPPLDRRVRGVGITPSGETTAYPRDRTVSELFGERVLDSPDAVALVTDHVQWTYRTLDERANAIAGRIQAAMARHRVSVPARVGVCLERAPETIAVLLGILKAGCAYVPLDPSHPPARLAALVQQAGIGLIVSDSQRSACLTHMITPVLRLDAADDKGKADEPRTTPLRAWRAGPDDLAYVLFTSGTSGHPKAVGVPHRAIVRLVHGMGQVPLGAGQTVLQLAPLAFDASTFEIWGALLSGGRLAVAPDLEYSAASLASLIARHHVTVMWLTASLFNAVIDDRANALTGLSHLLIGGETLSAPHVRRALAALPATCLINGYGPTEATTFTTLHPITADDVQPGRAVPIGRPLANTWVYVLGPDRQPVSDGAPGELWIGGDGLAVGYLDDPELTAARFARDPFVDDERARIYRSGDEVRWSPDGNLEFLGRLDDQIKLRGFRIEPGEVETAIGDHPGVARVAVAAVDRPVVGRLLAAFLVPVPTETSRERREGLVADVREFLRDRLPAYMIPSQWLCLDALPLLSSGKVDRRALATLALDGTPARGDVEPVSRPPERTLLSAAALEGPIADIWRAVLGVDAIRPTDNFFDLGGHSLLATQVVSRIQSALGLDVNLRTLFESPTVADLAAAAARSSATPTRAPIPRARRENLPLSFAQQRLWFLHHWFTDASTYNVPYAFRMEGALDVEALAAAIQGVVDRHEALRTVLPLESGGPVQRVVEGLRVSLPLMDLSNRPFAEAEHAAAAIARSERTRPFDLTGGPLFRASLIRLNDRVHWLLVSMHHVICDGWSMDVLMEDLAALYGAARRRTPSPLPPLPVQYADFAVWQRAELTAAHLEPNLAYWRAQLAPPLPVLALPADRLRPPEASGRGERVRIEFTPDLVDGLARLCRQERVTPFVALLTAFYVVLHRHTRQDDICVGTPVAGRTRPDVERLIGCFINTLALRADLSGRPTLRRLLARTQAMVLDAQVHQDVPFEMIVDALGVPRDTGHSPIFQAMFTMDPEGANLGRWPDLALSTVPADQNWAKFDLTLDLVESASGVRGSLQYNPELFDASRMERFASDYLRIVRAATAIPDVVIDDVDLDVPDGGVTAAGRGIAAARTSAPTAAAGSSGAQAGLLAIWSELLGVRAIGLDDNFFDLGGNSLLAVRLVAAIEQQFGLSLPLATLFREGTVARQARLIEQRGLASGSASSIIVPIHSGGEGAPLFLVHGIGGEVISFQALARHVGERRAIYGLQADPGHRDSLTTLEALASKYLDAVRLTQPKGPYRLGGYSAGGSIAFEMAQQLHARGDQVSLLLMLDAPAPGVAPPPLTFGSLWRQVKNAAYWPVDDEFFRMDAASRRARVGAWFRRMNHGSGTEGGQLRSSVNVLDRLGLYSMTGEDRASVERYVNMIRAYRPKPYDGAVTLLRARTMSLRSRRGPDMGWSALAPGRVTVHVIPGAHDTILREPHVGLLARALVHSLDASDT